ncbi:SDR family oxidoreductase [Actinoplanes utahensis]|uniref:NmrA family transcriptional regulator n=1 Tax=Actinoplanes utahensis TaxID=1869 RepID=A0A0A6URX3_ACTUT|nr:NAD(P)H-binding protein [Actinoplanes utahensis]KHD78186.1 NmrA family transcriptional regulator [Actinoplanes utahensis]GIF30698.1 NmrA family transcriptional regulator [Actinoplanes utahensis]
MYVVTGATGNVGRPLVRALAAGGVPVRAVSRQAPGNLPAGVDHHRADLARPESLRDVVAGADAFFLLVSGAGAHLDAPAILDVVKAGGVRRIVLLSSQAAGTRPDSVSHAPLRALEDTVRESGLDWTVLRPGGFASNAFAWAPQVRETRTVTSPFGNVALPVVDPADIAEVAAAALRDHQHGGRVYELTGPEAATPRDRAAAIAAALGEPVRFADQPAEEARAQMLTVMPAPVVDGTLDILGHPTEREQQVSTDIPEILGRPARPFGDWVRRHLDVFR